MKMCKNCLKEVTHVFSHRNIRNATQGRNIYKDVKGRAWDAATCPDCTGKYAKVSRGLPTVKLTNKPCTVCTKLLPQGRRYFHEECQSLISSRYYDIDSDYSFKI